MGKFWTVVGYTFFSKFKSRSFLITMVIMIGLVILLTNLPALIEQFSGGNQDKQVVVIDETGGLLPALSAQVHALDKQVNLVESQETRLEALKEQVLDDKYEALLILINDARQLPTGTWYADNLANTALVSTVQSALQTIKNNKVAESLHLSHDELALLNEPISIEQIALESDAKSQEELSQTRGLVYILLFVIYFAVIMYSNMIGMEIAIEKSQRVMEILVSSISPVQHMFAKILGVALLSLVQIGAFLLAGYLGMRQFTQRVENGFFEVFGFSDVSMMTFIYALIFVLLGYFLYATLAAFLGSIVSRVEDVNQVMLPSTILLIIGFFIAMFSLGNPSTSLVTVSSYIPFFSPMLMFMRVGMLSVPIWEVMLSIAILVITIILLGWFGARVYKGGVLMYSQKNSLKDVVQAFKRS